MKPHKHAELIKAWADGAEIQYRIYSVDSWADWRDCAEPTWITDWDFEYRIKPEPKPDVVSYLTRLSDRWIESYEQYSLYDTILIIRDGETRKLKSAEVLK